MLQSHFRLGALLKLDGTRPPVVDLVHHRYDLGAGLGVVVPALERRYPHLDKHELPSPLRTALEEPLKRDKLEGYSLEALHPVDRGEYYLAGELVADVVDLRNRAPVAQDLVDNVRLYPRVDARDADVSPVRVDGEVVAAGRVGEHTVVEAEEPPAAGEEVTGVLEQVESDLVGVEHAPEQVLAAP